MFFRRGMLVRVARLPRGGPAPCSNRHGQRGVPAHQGDSNLPDAAGVHVSCLRAALSSTTHPLSFAARRPLRSSTHNDCRPCLVTTWTVRSRARHLGTTVTDIHSHTPYPAATGIAVGNQTQSPRAPTLRLLHFPCPFTVRTIPSVAAALPPVHTPLTHLRPPRPMAAVAHVYRPQILSPRDKMRLAMLAVVEDEQREEAARREQRAARRGDVASSRSPSLAGSVTNSPRIAPSVPLPPTPLAKPAPPSILRKTSTSSFTAPLAPRTPASTHPTLPNAPLPAAPTTPTPRSLRRKSSRVRFSDPPEAWPSGSQPATDFMLPVAASPASAPSASASASAAAAPPPSSFPSAFGGGGSYHVVLGNYAPTGSRGSEASNASARSDPFALEAVLQTSAARGSLASARDAVDDAFSPQPLRYPKMSKDLARLSGSSAGSSSAPGWHPLTVRKKSSAASLRVPEPHTRDWARTTSASTASATSSVISLASDVSAASWAASVASLAPSDSASHAAYARHQSASSLLSNWERLEPAPERLSLASLPASARGPDSWARPLVIPATHASPSTGGRRPSYASSAGARRPSYASSTASASSRTAAAGRLDSIESITSDIVVRPHESLAASSTSSLAISLPSTASTGSSLSDARLPAPHAAAAYASLLPTADQYVRQFPVPVINRSNWVDPDVGLSPRSTPAAMVEPPLDVGVLVPSSPTSEISELSSLGSTAGSTASASTGMTPSTSATGCESIDDIIARARCESLGRLLAPARPDSDGERRRKPQTGRKAECCARPPTPLGDMLSFPLPPSRVDLHVTLVGAARASLTPPRSPVSSAVDDATPRAPHAHTLSAPPVPSAAASAPALPSPPNEVFEWPVRAQPEPRGDAAVIELASAPPTPALTDDCHEHEHEHEHEREQEREHEREQEQGGADYFTPMPTRISSRTGSPAAAATRTPPRTPPPPHLLAPASSPPATPISPAPAPAPPRRMPKSPLRTLRALDDSASDSGRSSAGAASPVSGRLPMGARPRLTSGSPSRALPAPRHMHGWSGSESEEEAFTLTVRAIAERKRQGSGRGASPASTHASARASSSSGEHEHVVTPDPTGLGAPDAADAAELRPDAVILPSNVRLSISSAPGAYAWGAAGPPSPAASTRSSTSAHSAHSAQAAKAANATRAVPLKRVPAVPPPASAPVSAAVATRIPSLHKTASMSRIPAPSARTPAAPALAPSVPRGAPHSSPHVPTYGLLAARCGSGPASHPHTRPMPTRAVDGWGEPEVLVRHAHDDEDFSPAFMASATLTARAGADGPSTVGSPVGRTRKGSPFQYF
ncbi:hypothetical protein Q5752_002122 [Cryptotrichosporon argae]